MRKNGDVIQSAYKNKRQETGDNEVIKTLPL